MIIWAIPIREGRKKKARLRRAWVCLDRSWLEAKDGDQAGAPMAPCESQRHQLFEVSARAKRVCIA
jgi:hypothetical protein